MLFDRTHILYMLISSFITAGLLVLAYFFVKTQKGKERVLKIAAIVTVAIHFSSLWVDFFRTGEATVQESMLIPLYPCNICMWLLLIVSLWKNRKGVAYTVLCEFTFWAGVVCGSLGIILNENYGRTPDLRDYEILKGLVSHSTMVFGALYLLVGKFMRIRVFNTVSGACGLLLFILDGYVINTLYAAFGLSPCNAMYLLETPFPQMPWLSPYLMGVMALVLVFGITALHEQLSLPKEERWYELIRANKDKDKIKDTKDK